MSEATVAVAIVYLNKADQTLESVRCFAASGAPVYVLNNGSTASASNKVRAACQEWANVRHFDSDANLGCGGGRNFLVRVSQEPWLLFVDNDITIEEPDWLHNVHLHIQHSKDVDVIVPVIHNVWDGTKVRPVRMSVQDGQAIFTTLSSAYSNMFPGGGAIVNRALFERIGLYDEELLAFEDFELALRATRLGQEICSKHVHDINLLHDHRVVTNSEDKIAVATRYDANRVGSAHEKVKRTYGVTFDDNYKAWLDQQILEMTDPNWKRHHAVNETTFQRLMSKLRKRRTAR